MSLYSHKIFLLIVLLSSLVLQRMATAKDEPKEILNLEVYIVELTREKLDELGIQDRDHITTSELVTKIMPILSKPDELLSLSHLAVVNYVDRKLQTKKYSEVFYQDEPGGPIKKKKEFSELRIKVLSTNGELLELDFYYSYSHLKREQTTEGTSEPFLTYPVTEGRLVLDGIPKELGIPIMRGEEIEFRGLPVTVDEPFVLPRLTGSKFNQYMIIIAEYLNDGLRP